MISALMPDRLTIVRPGRSKDRYGNEIADWTKTTRKATYGRLVSRSIATSESHNVIRVAVEDARSLILPPDADIDAFCRVEFSDGSRYEVDGFPTIRRTARRVHHITVNLKAVT
ncbi:hypothetical protein [Kitasatospora sp. NPDC001132]